ncbi:hypothetical protein J7E63_15915 [Bacillus sp. ISL-75]|uniref:hypothetical protein n=1 Tax=Bacillus sp. ISL-75 TaxID=2819137 RepID=UPI001BE8DC5D|nr:hypothetical protein [Bacillus sp. ISL-75]MBT2728416.1 hypothetical protein [Bacillus sp. ISL-75]
MVYIKDGRNYKTLKEIAVEYKLSLELIQGRAARGLKSIEELTKPKYHNFK